MRFLRLAPVLILGVVFTACSAPSLPSPVSSSPLPDCPDSPNCEHVSKTYDVDPDTLFDAAVQALNAIGPSGDVAAAGTRQRSAVFRVGLVFKDDLDLAVTSGAPSPDTTRNTEAPADTMAAGASSVSSSSTLHVRSASRVGYSDLGVNARRVKRLLDAVDRELAAARP